MFLRRFILWTVPFCLCALFGESFLLTAVGTFAKMYLRIQKGWKLEYTALDWKERNLVFSDFSLKQDHYFTLHAPVAFISVQNRHVKIDRPIVSIAQIPSMDSSESSQWKLSIDDGMIEGMGLPSSSFSLFNDPLLGREQIEMKVGPASIFIEMSSDSGIPLIDVSCDRFPIGFLKPWTGNQWEGTVHGSFRLMKEGALWSVLEGSIEAEEIGCDEMIQGVCGRIDWGNSFNDRADAKISSYVSLGENRKLKLQTQTAQGIDWERMFDEGRLRLNISRGNIFGKKQKPIATDLLGCLSFDGKAGAKWELSFQSLGRTMQETGRGFFHSLKGRWIESELRSADASIILQCHEKNEGYIWDVTAASLPADLISWVQDVATIFGYSSFDGSLEEGVVSGSAQVYLDKMGKLDWTIFDCSLERIRLHHDKYDLSCREFSIHENLYFFREGALFFDGLTKGVDWTGEGDLKTGLGSVSGKVGDLFLTSHFQGNLDSLLAHIHLTGLVNGELAVQAKREDQNICFEVSEGKGTFFSSFMIEHLQMKGDVGLDGFSLFDVRGVLDVGKKVPFYFPILQTEGQFDLRFEHPLFDLARFVGDAHSGQFILDEKRSHLLGSPLTLGRGYVSSLGFEQLCVACDVPWKIFPFLFDIPERLEHIVSEDPLHTHVSYDKEKGIEMELVSELFYQGNPMDLHLHFLKKAAVWRLEQSNIWECAVEGTFQFENEGLQVIHAKAEWGEGFRTEFGGRVSSLDLWDLNLSRLYLDLESIPQMKEWGIEGVVEGGGILHWREGLESDFDITISRLKANHQILENEGPLHVYCSSKKGVYVRGLNLSVGDSEVQFSSANCKLGLFQYDLDQQLVILTQSQFYIPSDLIQRLQIQERFPLLSEISKESFHGIADLAFSLDFSSFSLSMKEIDIPLNDEKYHIQNLHFDMDHKDCKINFDLDHQSRLIPMDLAFHLEPSIAGRLTIENGLKIDWVYQDRLILQAIKGMCAGLEASFHLDGDSLIGSARLNGNELRGLLPQKISRVFHELKIGNGYELMGRLFFSDQGLGFRGILSGKQIELFDFEFKNILAQIQWDTEHFHISDLKISDFAGVLKVDHILAKGVGDAPWTISIPNITMTELRPSLLQDVGGPPGKLNPLVVRELKIEDFHGLVDDSKTYTAKGQLYFINSYKRETSILELPSDLLSRIVGLDLDLLIPVCGTLRYELHDGFFHFTELEGSFSENKRSEFFLVFNQDSPKMDLDWNLSILIQMKQFVLFKFTEAFIISVTGKLDDPKVQLQRKKRFLGVL